MHLSLSFRRRSASVPGLILAALAASALSGCGVGNVVHPSTSTPASSQTYAGRVIGGQQPVSGAHVFLYAVSQGVATGASVSLLTAPGYVTTDSGGNFSITGDYTCPTGAYVYVLALGGNPGLAAGTNNMKLALATGVGDCATLTPTTTISVNEVTTVATAYALAAFATSEQQIGFADAPDMQSAFASIPSMVNTSNGLALSATPMGNGIVPQTKIYSLADIVATCVNSDGTGTACSRLLGDTGAASSSTPDTFQAMLNLAKNPGSNVGDLYGLVNSSGPFQPTLATQPNDWSLPISFPGPVSVRNNPSSASVPVTGSVPITAYVSGASGTPFSYRWSENGSVGALNDSIQTSSNFCSPSSSVVYQPNTALTASNTDAVSVQLFTGAGCLPGNAVATSAATNVAVGVPPQGPGLPGAAVNNGFTATVALPSGSTLAPNQLRVINSLASVTPSAAGVFTLPTYAGGPTVAIVLSPNGNPMLMGWLDSTHNVINAESTAEVMAYYALGGPLMFTLADKTALEADIVNASGITNVGNVIAQEIGQNPDAFASLDRNLETALNNFFQGIVGVTPRTYSSIKAHVKPQLYGKTFTPQALTPKDDPAGTGILVQPGAQSGIQVNISSNPDAVNAVNSYRRRVHVYLQRLADIDANGVSQDDESNITDFDLGPTTGLSGGVLGTLNDIINAYWSNGTTAYVPVTSADMSVPVQPQYAKTKYQVTVVGAGANTTTYANLSGDQQAQQIQTAVEGFVQDAMIPLLSNLYFGTQDLTTLTPDPAFPINWRKDLTTDFFAALSNYSTIKNEIASGDYAGALQDVIDNIRQGGTFRDVFADSLQQAAGKYTVSAFGSSALQSIGATLAAAGGILQIFDTSVYVSQLAQSDEDDEWSVTNGGQKVVLTPTNNQLLQFGTGTSTLSTSLPGLENTSNISYLYTNTGLAGNIAPSDGSQAPSLSFCSSQPAIVYATNASPLLTQPVTDIINVTAYAGGNCQSGNALGKAPAVEIQVSPDGVLTDPGTVAISGSQSASLNAYIAGVNDNSYSFLFQLSPFGDSPLAATMQAADGSGASGTSFCLSNKSSVNITIKAQPGIDNTSTLLNALNVSGYHGTGCQSSNYLGKASTVPVQIAPHGLLLQPRKSSTPQNKGVVFSAILTDIDTTQGTYSYQWSESGGDATLQSMSGTITSGSTLCTTTGEVYLIPNGTPILTQKVTDTVSVQAFSGAGCVSAKSLTATLSTPITILPKIVNKTLPLPNAVFAPMQAWDGNFYATSALNGNAIYASGNPGRYITNAACAYNTQNGTNNDCGVIYQITPQGVQTAIHTFAHGTGNIDVPENGGNPGQVIQGPDGALYGITADGLFFRVGLDGTFAALNNINTIIGTKPFPFAGNFANPYHMVLGSDGYFYAYGLPAFASLNNDYIPLCIVRLDTGGVAQVFQLPQQTDQTQNGIAYLANLIEGSDGNFYGIAHGLPGTNGDYYFFSFTRGGVFTTLYEIPDAVIASNDAGANYGTLVEGPDGAFYTHRSSGFLRLTAGGYSETYDEPYATFPFTYNGEAVSTPGFDLIVGAGTSNELNITPQAAVPESLMVASDGNMYGTTLGTIVQRLELNQPTAITALDPGCVVQNNLLEAGGCNTIFQLTPGLANTSDSPFTNIYTFQGGDDGITPGANTQIANPTGLYFDNGEVPFQDSNGYIVGTTYAYPTAKNPTMSGTLFEASNHLPPPIQLNLMQNSTSVSSISLGQSVTMQWTVLGGYSLTAQQCYAFIQKQPDGTTSTGAGNWTGKQLGISSAGSYTGTAVITPTASGSYTYALTCGGRQSGFVTLQVN